MTGGNEDKEIRAMKASLKALAKDFKKLAKEHAKLMQSQEKIDASIKSLQKEVNNLSSAYANIEKSIASSQEQAKKLADVLRDMQHIISSIPAEEKPYEEERLNAFIATELVRIYFQEIASSSLKRSLKLSELVSAYKFALKKLEEKEVEKKPAPLEEIKKAVEQPKVSVSKGFSYTNRKGETYYLHKKGKLYYFSKDPEGAVPLPSGYYIRENPSTGMPVLKKS